jgi:hypothetical protein
VGVLISPIVRTVRDIQGNEAVDVYSIYEYRDAGIQPGGETIDLSPYMRRAEFIHAQPVSGVFLYEARPNATDFPGNPGSGRMELYYTGSGIVTLAISGLGIQVTSGQTFTVSGVLPLISGRLVIGGSGTFAVGLNPIQLLSGTAVSGVRAYIHAFGF